MWFTRTDGVPKPYARTTFLIMRLEQLSDTVKRSIERGTDTIARAARRGALLGGLLGGMTGVLLVGVGVLIGRVM